ncbi:MAG: DUF488 family protein [Ignavibacteria bacterium]|nr:DUF488 family protein [Ignavibacteria bacterium]
MSNIKIKRAYEKPARDDGYRVLVDRLWPRGIKKENAKLNEWNKDIAPSADLRKWFGHIPEKFERFTDMYKKELKDKSKELKRLKSIAKTKNLTLVYSAKNETMNQAVVLLHILNRLK